MLSQTLALIREHWIGTPPDTIDLPFHVENFCRHNDAFLDLIRVDPNRILFAKQTALPISPKESVIVWKVIPGRQFDQGPRPAAIAWFRYIEDMNRFIFRDGDAEILRLRAENAELKGRIAQSLERNIGIP